MKTTKLGHIFSQICLLNPKPLNNCEVVSYSLIIGARGLLKMGRSLIIQSQRNVLI